MKGYLVITAIIVIALVIIIIREEYIKKKITEKLKKEFEAKIDSIIEGQEIMVSQIQPHFIYNVLNTIKYLCKRNPDEALTAIDCFSNFLRESMYAFNSLECVPFLQEIQIVENYVYLEKCRFGNKVEVKMDLAVTDFELPALSIQPMVENAIKHGITKKLGGGTVWIKTYQDEENNYVEIIDNGVGFYIDKYDNNDGKRHIGIMNTQNRISSMCKGTFFIESKVDSMTKVLMSFPRENQDGKYS